MSKNVYACLLGNWVCLNDDVNCKIGNNNQSPYEWYEENAPIWYPINRNAFDNKNSFYDFPYVNIFYKGNSYRIHPSFIQIVVS